MTDFFKRPTISVRAFIIAFLCLLLLIPAAIIENLIEERRDRRDQAIEEVSGKWGLPQTISGPFLTIPLRRVLSNNLVEPVALVNLHIMPDALEMAGELIPQTRSRGIYDVILYTTDVTIKGHFDLSTVPYLKQPDYEPIWSDAKIILGISDLRGIRKNVVLTLNEQQIQAVSGIFGTTLVKAGITMSPQLNPEKTTLDFQLPLQLNGSSEILFAPLGRKTDVHLKSSWSSPSFTGSFLPDQRKVESAGFSASWTIFELNRNFPQSWLGNQFHFEETEFGVKLLNQVDTYQKNLRSAKYAILIITLTFLVFFLAEVLLKVPFHPIQYIFIGLSLLLFYVLLLAFSEHIGFTFSYCLSALATLISIGFYTSSASSRRVAYVIASVLGSVYVFLFIVLRNEDFALLMGATGLFAVMSIVLFLTRKIDWYNLGESQSSSSLEPLN